MRCRSPSARASERGSGAHLRLAVAVQRAYEPDDGVGEHRGPRGRCCRRAGPAAMPMKNGPATCGSPPSPPSRSAVRPRTCSASSPSIASGTVNARISKRPVACATKGRDQSKLVMSPARRRLERLPCAASSVPRVSRLRCRRCGSSSATSAAVRCTRLASPATRKTSIGPRWWPRIRPENGRSTSERTPTGPSRRAVPAAQKADRFAGATSLVSSCTVIAAAASSRMRAGQMPDLPGGQDAVGVHRVLDALVEAAVRVVVEPVLVGGEVHEVDMGAVLAVAAPARLLHEPPRQRVGLLALRLVLESNSMSVTSRSCAR